MAFMDKCAQKNSALKKLVRAAIRAWSITQAARPVNAPQTTTAGFRVPVFVGGNRYLKLIMIRWRAYLMTHE
jgi:hypothetical protein